MNGKPQVCRHGENNFIPAELPKGAKLIESGKSLIVGHSESGHHHTMTLDKTTSKDLEIKIFEHEGVTYLDVPFQAKLEHQKTAEKHDTITFAPGIYKKSDHKSWSYSEKLMRRTLD